MLKGMTSYEITEWAAFFQYENAQMEKRPNPNNVPSTMPPPTSPEQVVYDEIIPDDLF